MKLLKTLIFFFWLIQLSAQNLTLKNYTIKDNLPSNKITNITQDNVGFLWFISNDNLIRFDGLEFKKIEIKTRIINILNSKNDSLLIATNKELIVKAQNKISRFNSKKITAILVAKGKVFLGTTQGIFLLKEDYLAPQKTNFQIDLNHINDLKFDGTHYWIATHKALWKLDQLIQPTFLKRIKTDNFNNILIDSNNVYATNNSKIFSVKNDKTILKAQHLKEITDIKKISNQFWVATKNNGITVFNQDFLFVKNINKYNTLTTNTINKIVRDNQKNIWLATADKGLYKFSPTDSIIFKKPKISFDKIEVVYKVIDSISINNYNKVLPLSSDKNHISFSFKTVNINHPKKVLYRYKLNTEFSPWSSKNTVNFANLQAGHYNFIAQSKINNKESDPIKFSFYVDQPFYKKVWFTLGALGVTIAILGGLIFYYIKRIQDRNRVKLEKLKLDNHLLSLEQKALQLQMNPHFIFNVLNGIKALGNKGNTVELSHTVSKFATLLRGILNSSRVEEISLAEEIITLKNYIELEQQISSFPFQYYITTHLSLDEEEILVPPMLLQPLVENAIKHGIPTTENAKIKIDFSIKNDFLHCTLDDNGIGVEQSKKNKKQEHHSVAIKVTQERIENLSKNSKFSIRELKDKEHVIGTRVWFKIPLKTDF